LKKKYIAILVRVRVIVKMCGKMHASSYGRVRPFIGTVSPETRAGEKTGFFFL